MARTVYEEMLPRWLSTRESAKPPPQESAAARWPLLATLAAPVFTGLAAAWFFRGRRPALWSKKVRDVMVDEVVTIDPSATLADAARQMRDHNVGILPVIVAGELAGVITDRDLVVRALAEGADPTLTVVGEFASGAPIFFRPDPGLDETMEMGPSIAGKQWSTVMGYIEAGKQEGATLLTGGMRPEAIALSKSGTALINGNRASSMIPCSQSTTGYRRCPALTRLPITD